MKSDKTKWLLLAIIAMLAFGIYTGKINLSELAGKTGTSTSTSTTTIVYQSPVGTPIISQLDIYVKDKYSGQPVPGVQVQFYEPGANVRNPNVKPLFSATTDSNGYATISRTMRVDSASYDIYLNGSTNYYDEKLEAGSWKIDYNPQTGKGLLVVDNKEYIEATAVGEFYDLSNIPEASSAINTSAGPDTIAYIKSVGDGSAYFQIDIGNKKAMSELRDVVFCFMDSDGDMEGDELSGLTSTVINPGDGSIQLESNLLGYWQDAMGPGGKSCFKVADVIKGGMKARFEINMVVNEANWDPGEEFEIVLDDLGDAGAKDYPSRSTKAPQEKLIVTVQ